MNRDELKELVVNNFLLLTTAKKIRDKNSENYSNFMKLDYVCSKLKESYTISYQLLLNKYFKGNEKELIKFLN